MGKILKRYLKKTVEQDLVKRMVFVGGPRQAGKTTFALTFLSSATGSHPTYQCPSINGLLAQSLRYAQKIILGISTICLWLFFRHALILNKNPHLWMDTN